MQSITVSKISQSAHELAGSVVSLVGTITAANNGRYAVDDGSGVIESCSVHPDHADVQQKLSGIPGGQLVEIHGELVAGSDSASVNFQITGLRKAVQVEDAFRYGRLRGEAQVYLEGWIYNKRSSGKIRFVLVRDGSGICQCVVVKQAVSEYTFELSDSLAQESPIGVLGTLSKSAKAPGGFEIQVKELSYSALEDTLEYPITPKEHGIEYLMEHRHLWLRSNRPWAILRIRHTIVNAIRDFFNERGFILFDAPILTPAACEGTSTLFETEYFDEGPAYLTQSGQLYGEAGAMAFGKVYVFGPTFRAEKSKTKRHLTEFWMVEPEVAFMDLEGDMQLAEEFVHYVVGRVLAERTKELAILDEGSGRLAARCEKVLKPFRRLHYDEAAKILDKYWDEMLAKVESGEAELPPTYKRFTYGDDFGAYDEMALTSLYDEPVIVHHYPAEVKAFYMKRDPKEPDKALAMDVLFPEFGEIIGGSQREDSYEVLLQRLKEHDLPQEAFEWYLDLRRYGSVPHAGFGLGLERLVTWVCELEHIREAIPFPRTLNRIWP